MCERVRFSVFFFRIWLLMWWPALANITYITIVRRKKNIKKNYICYFNVIFFFFFDGPRNERKKSSPLCWRREKYFPNIYNFYDHLFESCARGKWQGKKYFTYKYASQSSSADIKYVRLCLKAIAVCKILQNCVVVKLGLDLNISKTIFFWIKIQTRDRINVFNLKYIYMHGDTE